MQAFPIHLDRAAAVSITGHIPEIFFSWSNPTWTKLIFCSCDIVNLLDYITEAYILPNPAQKEWLPSQKQHFHIAPKMQGGPIITRLLHYLGTNLPH